MPNYESYDYNQSSMIVINYQDQLSRSTIKINYQDQLSRSTIKINYQDQLSRSTTERYLLIYAVSSGR
jgi:hypothetical protein